MNLTKIRIDSDRIKKENAADVAHITRNLISENYDRKRLTTLISKSKQYESEHGKTRGNTNVITAATNLLNSLNSNLFEQ